NRSFDHIFATYVPTGRNQKALNLLSQGIVKADGSPGPNFAKGHQFQLVSPPNFGKFFISAKAANKSLYATSPPPDIGGLPSTSAAALPPPRPGGPPGPPATTPVPVRPRRARPHRHARSRLAHHQREHAAAWPVPADRTDHAVRRVHRRHDPPVLPDVAAD